MLGSTYSLSMGACIALLVLCCLSVAGRIYVRGVMLRKIDLGDYCMILTLVIFIPFWALIYLMMMRGLGHPDDTLDPDDYSFILKMYFFAEILYAFTTFTLKLSIGILLLRFVTTRGLRLVVFVTTIAYCLYAVALILIMSLQCVPAAKVWDTSITTGGCMPRKIFTDLIYVHAVNSIVTDGIYSFLPVALIWKMQIEKSIKISLMFVLSLGVIVMIVNAVRLKYIGDFDSPRPSSAGLFGIAITSIFEIGLGIVAASMANLRPLFVHFGVKTHHLFSRLGEWVCGKPQSPRTAPPMVFGPATPMARTHTVVSIEEWTNICVTSQVSPSTDDGKFSQCVTAVNNFDYEKFQIPKSFTDILDKV